MMGDVDSLLATHGDCRLNLNDLFNRTEGDPFFEIVFLFLIQVLI